VSAAKAIHPEHREPAQDVPVTNPSLKKSAQTPAGWQATNTQHSPQAMRSIRDAGAMRYDSRNLLSLS